MHESKRLQLKTKKKEPIIGSHIPNNLWFGIIPYNTYRLCKLEVQLKCPAFIEDIDSEGNMCCAMQYFNFCYMS